MEKHGGRRCRNVDVLVSFSGRKRDTKVTKVQPFLIGIISGRHQLYQIFQMSPDEHIFQRDINGLLYHFFLYILQ